MRRHIRVPWRWSVVGCAAMVVIGTAAVALVPPAHAAADRVAVSLNEIDLPGIASVRGVSGTAVLTADGGSTAVAMELEGRAVTGNHPTHIHTGTCEDFDPNPTFPLATVVLDPVDDTGVSESTVEDVSLDGLLEEDYVILVHRSAEDLTTYLVCGEIKESAETLPQSGTGLAASGHDGSGTPPLGLAALAAASAAWAVVLRGRRSRA